DDQDFAAPDPTCTCPQSIRIVEAYQTRRIGALAAGDPGGAESGPRAVSLDGLWTPQEGNAGLMERFARFRARPATAAEQAAPFALRPPPIAPALSADDNVQQLARWRAFCQSNFAFVPSIGAEQRGHWQAYLRSRHPGLDPSNIDLPADWPSGAERATDWRA